MTSPHKGRTGFDRIAHAAGYSLQGLAAAWRAVEPILGATTPLYEYEPNTWGPDEANRFIGEGGWHSPQVSP